MVSAAPERLVDVRTLSEHTGQGINTLRIQTRAGLIPHYRIGRSVRYRLSEVDRWLEQYHEGPVVASG